MRSDTNGMITVTEVTGTGVSKLVDETSGRGFVLVNNKPVGPLDGIEKLERFQRVEEDAKLLATAVVRTATDTGERVSLHDAAARFGIDLDELDDEDLDG